MNSKTSVDPIGKFKKNGPVTKERMLSLFNDCLREHKVPKAWKHSVISMLLKPAQSATQIGIYRPISMTPCIARLFEMLIL